MKQRAYPYVTISEKAEKSLKNGHLWVFRDELIFDNNNTAIENGCIVDVFSKNGKYLGSGFFNRNSKITIRIISKNANDKFDEQFWKRRVSYAVDYRYKTMPGEDFKCCRLIFGESDGFPGLTVDRFGSVLVSEVLSLGIEKRKDIIYKELVDALGKLGEKITSLYERNDGEIRALEGMEKYKGFYKAEGLSESESGMCIISENGIKYNVDYANGQKTGFFLDQKYNRIAIRKIAANSRVLDVCTHTGAFALNAYMGGAKSVTALDISVSALENAKNNAHLNQADGIEFIQSDMFDYLEKLVKSGNRQYDFIILDPPAFTKSSDTVKSAYRGYLRLNTLAMRALGRGGYLATCSCSHFMRDSYFCMMLNDAAREAGVSLMQIEGRQQGCDHPILWNMPESEYLKFYIFRII